MMAEQEEQWREEFERLIKYKGTIRFSGGVYADNRLHQKWIGFKTSKRNSDKEISQLKEELKRERSAVDFYANKVHWEKFTEAYSEYDYESRILCAMDCIIEYDVEIFEGKVFAARDHSVGGKLARQTQQRRRIDL